MGEATVFDRNIMESDFFLYSVEEDSKYVPRKALEDFFETFLAPYVDCLPEELDTYFERAFGMFSYLVGYITGQMVSQDGDYLAKSIESTENGMPMLEEKADELCEALEIDMALLKPVHTFKSYFHTVKNILESQDTRLLSSKEYLESLYWYFRLIFGVSIVFYYYRKGATVDNIMWIVRKCNDYADILNSYQDTLSFRIEELTNEQERM